MRRLAPADELAEIRAEMARLQARATQLEAALIRSPDLRIRGTWHIAEVCENRVSLFDPALMPPEIHNNPAYWREVVERLVTVIPVRARPVPLRPGWPIRRAGDGSLPLH